MTPGTYVWTLDAARFNNDTITLNVLEPSGVPVPAPLALMTVGMLGLWAQRRRRSAA